MSYFTRKGGIFLLVVVLLTPLVPLGAVPAAAQSTAYQFTQGTLNGTLKGVQKALSTYAGTPCLTEAQLMAMVLAIPLAESVSNPNGSELTPAMDTARRELNPSPMTLSRWDTWGASAPGPHGNQPMYSFRTFGDNKRAHDNPGKGLWQFDTWTRTLRFEHARAANTKLASKPVASFILEVTCPSSLSIQNAWLILDETWLGCKRDGQQVCYHIYQDLYDSGSLNVAGTPGGEFDGGVVPRVCRWASSQNQTEFRCLLYNIDWRQGSMQVGDPSGLGAMTPIASAFISFRRSDGTGIRKKYAWWGLSDTPGSSTNILKKTPETDSGRGEVAGFLSGTTFNWSNDSNLQVLSLVSMCPGTGDFWQFSSASLQSPYPSC